MKSAVSLALSMCLVSSAFPVAAQDGIVATPGPIARAITREAAHLATAGEPTPSGVEAVQQGVKPTQTNWSRVSKLAPGTKIVVTVKGSQPATRYLVRADESNLTVLNLTDPALPGTATRVLRDMASRHPEYFGAAQKRETFVEKNVRFADDGVFVADQRVADRDRIVEFVPMAEVVEITARRRHGSGLGALGGAVGISLLTWALEANASPSWGLYFTSLFGAPLGGAVVGYYAFGHTLEEVIYRVT